MAKHGAHISLIDVEKVYGAVTALHPTNLDIQPGEFFSIIGPSGSGKTTLLGAIAGFTPPSSGRIEVDKVDIARLPPYRRNIGMVFQNYALFPHLNVFENIAFSLKLRKLPKKVIAERVAAMLATVRLTQMADRKPSQLSGGQQQRVALARAAVYDPRMLLMDEPLGALDKNLREEMQNEIKAFHRNISATVLYVTHDQDEATAMSDRIAIMNAGRVAQCGAPRELYEHPNSAFVASFLGGANLFRVTAVEDRGSGAVTCRTAENQIYDAAGSSHGIAPDKPHVLCVRPEAVEIADADSASSAGGFNRAKGSVVDAVYTAGTFRYQVDVGAPEPVSIRRAATHRTVMFQPGQEVVLSWPASATLLIPET